MNTDNDRPPQPDPTDGVPQSRRHVLCAIGAIGMAALTGCEDSRDGIRPAAMLPTANAGNVPPPAAACIISPEVTEGPFFVDEKLKRADLRTGSKDPATVRGVPLALKLQLTDAGRGCGPIAGAIVDVWHANAAGVYSDIADGPMAAGTAGENFFRGYQVSDAGGMVEFLTIFPGWYPGRTAHIHLKVRARANGRTVSEYTTQLFFDDALADRVYASKPYVARGARDRNNRDDDLFDRRMLVALTPEDGGLAGRMTLGLSQTA